METDNCTPVPEKVALFFQNGSSDKTYQVQLEAVDNGLWDVNAQNGKRGSSLIHRKKTKAPVDYNVAKKIYDRLIASKKSNGYTENGSGVAYAGTEDAGKVSGYLPQLANDVTEEEIFVIFQSGRPMWMQIKHDGERRGVRGANHEAEGANRKGLVVALEEKISAAVIALARRCGGALNIDTEDMGDHLVIFDILAHGDEWLEPQGFGVRAVRLDRLNQMISHNSLNRHLKVDVPTIPKSIQDVKDFIAAARANREEGVIFRFNTAYKSGRPNSGGDLLRFKFWKSATCRIRSLHETKNSMGLEICKIQKNNIDIEWMFVGNCTVNYAKKGLSIGDLVEIKYLYAYRGGSLFEPSFKSKRTDLVDAAAHIGQLEYKK